MRYQKINDKFIVKIEKDEKLTDSLETLCIKLKIKSGWFQGLGAVKSSRLAFYDLSKKQYLSKNIEYLCEIASLVGNIAKLDKKYVFHIHCALSDKNFKTIAGHLEDAVCGGTIEIFLVPFLKKLKRTPDKSTGLNLLDL